LESDKKMERWFQKRHKNKVLDIAYRQITLALDTVSDLAKAIKSASEGDKKKVEAYMSRLFKVEEEIDDLRRTVFESLAKGLLLLKDREDIMHLVKRLDTMADHVKDSGRTLLILKETEIPQEIWRLYIKMSEDLVECAKNVRRSLEKLDEDATEARKYAREVDRIEGMVDEKYLHIKKLLLRYGEQLGPSKVIFLKDLLESMERIADTCDDTADYIRILTA